MGDIFTLNSTQSRILQALFEHETLPDDCKLTGTTSYQLSKTEPKIPIGTWNDHYKFLEANHLIKRHKLKKEDGRGTKPYSVTSLGIIQFCNNLEKIDRKTLERILVFLKCKYIEGKPEDEASYIELFKDYCGEIEYVYLKEDEIQRSFLTLLSRISLIVDSGYILIHLNYETSYGLTTMMNEIYIYSDGSHLLSYDHSISDGNSIKLEEREFEYLVSQFIIRSFSFDIVNKFVDLQKVARFRSKAETQLNHIPLQIHGLAREFYHELNRTIQDQYSKIHATHYEIKSRFDQAGEKHVCDIKDEEIQKHDNFQINAYYDLVDRISNEKIQVKNKTELKKLMLKTKAWKDKKDLNEFCETFPKMIRRTFGEEIADKEMYYRVFGTEIRANQRWLKKHGLET